MRKRHTGFPKRKEDRPKGRPSANVGQLLLQGEDPEGTSGRDVLQPLVARKERVDAADAARYRDHLHAILLPGDRLTLDAGPGLEVPELLASVGIEGFE